MPRVLKATLLLLLTASMWYYVDGVLIPYQKAESIANGMKRGNLSDLYPRWLGTRELILNGRDPYSNEVTRQIQLGYWGQVLDASNTHAPKDEARFAYPLYVIFFLFPTIRLPFHLVQAGSAVVLLIVTIASVLLWLRALNLQVGTTMKAVFVVATVGSFPVVQGLHLQQLTLAVCGFMAAACAAAASGWFIPAGILLGFSTIKPQLVAPLAAWLVLWALSDWHSRKKLVLALAVTMLFLLLGAEAVMQGWFGRWWAGLGPYIQYNDSRSPLQLLLGREWGVIVSALLVAVAAAMCWRFRREPAASPTFALGLMLVLAVTLMVKPRFPSYDQLLLLPSVLWLASSWRRITAGIARRVLLFVVAAVVSWEWLGALALTIIALFVSPATAQRAWTLPLYTIFLIPVAVSCALGLVAADALGAPSKRSPVSMGA